MHKLHMVLIVAALISALVIPVIADTAAVCVVHKGEWVWVRSAPAHDADKIDTIRYGVECRISEIVNQYAHVKYRDGCEGWVDVSYLEIPIRETIYQVTTESPLNKRETPDGRFLTKIKAGARISVLGWRYSKKGELWAKVYRGGYVKAEYLREVDQ